MTPFSRSRNENRSLAFLIPALIAMCLMLVACGGPSVEKLMAEAKRFRDNGDNTAAIIQLKNVLQQDPNNGGARFLLGQVYVELGDSDSAEKEFREALRVGYPIIEVLPLLSRVLIQQEEFEKVLTDTRSSKHGEAALTPVVLAMRGHAQLSLGQDDDAIKSFDEALQKQPDLPDALLGRARVALLKSDTSAALGYVNRALVGAPKHADAWVMKGDMDRLAGRNVEALEAFRKAVKLEPGNVSANINLASMHMAAGKFEDARAHVNVLRQVAPDNPLGYYLSGVLELQSGNLKGADSAAKDALKLSPNYLPGAALAGAIAYSTGSLSRAEEYLRSVVAKNPNGVYSRKLLAATLLKAQKADQALEILLPAIEMTPEDPALLAMAAEASVQGGKFDKAIGYYEKATAISPKSAWARAHLGMARFASGDKDRALADLESAAGLETGGQANVLRILTSLSRKEYDKAEKAVQAMEKEQPNNPLTYNLKAAVLGGRGKLADARAALEKAITLQPTFLPAVINLAQLDLRERNPQAARQRFETILQKDPNNLQALLALAGFGGQLGAKPEEIVGWLERARKGNPAAVQPRLQLARYYLQSGDAKKAADAAEEARKFSPDEPNIIELLGRAQLLGGQANAAVQTFSGLVTRQPKLAVGHLLLAEAHLANQNAPAASISLRKALELKPELVEAQSALAGIDTRAGRFTEALQIADQVKSAAPKSSVGYALEGDVRMAEKKYSLAVVAYEKAFAIAKTGPLIVARHGALVQAGRTEEAEAALLSWLKSNPEDLQTRLYLADVGQKTGKHRLAIDQYEWVLRHQPQNLLALNNLAWAYFQANDPRAVEMAAKAYALNPESPQIVDTYGWLLVNAGRVDKGLDLLDRAATLAPEQQEIRYHYAVALAKAGKIDAAVIELQRTLASKTKFPQEAEAVELLKRLRN
ncbi:MAG TPA: XrtA/PEP-CTERM system TPR-repeat protein PrsT [Burkholderiales bacterium]|nr:XrtA/PEP-CTERM system TPR-repeat protein PrsT [Burkholderiales bacterium]